VQLRVLGVHVQGTRYETSVGCKIFQKPPWYFVSKQISLKFKQNKLLLYMFHLDLTFTDVHILNFRDSFQLRMYAFYNTYGKPERPM
jgi:hypothetical protein